MLDSIKNTMKNILKEIKNFFVSQPVTVRVLLLLLLLLIAVRVCEGLVYGLNFISFDGMFNTIYAVTATLYIAPIIAIYGLYRKSSFLVRAHIKDQNLHHKIIGIAFLIAIGLSSQYPSYRALVAFVLLWELIYISRLLNNLVTENLFDVALRYLAKSIEKPPDKAGETVKAFKKYIKDLEPNILYLVKQNNFPQFREELERTIYILDEIKESKPMDIELSDLVFSIKKVVKPTTEFRQHKFLKDELFKFCIRLFETCTDSKNNQYMETMFDLIIDCFEANIFKSCNGNESDLKKFEWRITSVINFGEPTENFFTSYIKVLNKFVKENMGNPKNTNKFDRFDFAASLLGNLSDDLKEDKLHNITPELKSYLQKTLIFLAAILLERDKNSNGYESEITNFIKRIHSDQLMENLHELFHHSLPEFNPLYQLRSFMPEPNRHGVSSYSMIGNNSPAELYSIFLRKYIEHNQKFLEQVLEQVKSEIHKYYTLKPLFKSLLEKVDEKDNVHKGIVSEIIKLCDNIEKEKIIKTSLSKVRIKEFINDLHKSYEDVERISKYCAQSCETQKAENFFSKKMEKSRLGMRQVYPKEWFIDDPSYNISTKMISQDIGRGMVQYENHVIFNQLYEHMRNNKFQYRKLNRNDFDKEDIFSKWKGKDKSYIILTNDNLYAFSNIKNIPKVHYIDWNKKLAPRRFCMLVKKDTIHLDFVLWKKDPHYPKHEQLEYYENISYKITDLAKDEEFMKDIVKNNTKFSEDGLRSKVLIAVYLCPKVNTEKSNFKEIELVELTDPQQT